MTQIKMQSGHDNSPLAEELYQMLMREIEPDLLLENIPGLDEKYLGETPEQRTERMKRYEAAYARFDAEFQTFQSAVSTSVTTGRLRALRMREESDRAGESSALQSLEGAFE